MPITEILRCAQDDTIDLVAYEAILRRRGTIYRAMVALIDREKGAINRAPATEDVLIYSPALSAMRTVNARDSIKQNCNSSLPKS